MLVVEVEGPRERGLLGRRVVEGEGWLVAHAGRFGAGRVGGWLAGGRLVAGVDGADAEGRARFVGLALCHLLPNME